MQFHKKIFKISKTIVASEADSYLLGVTLASKQVQVPTDCWELMLEKHSLHMITNFLHSFAFFGKITEHKIMISTAELAQ